MDKLCDRYEGSWWNWTHNPDLQPPQHNASVTYSHHLHFPTYLKIHATEKGIIKTFPKLTFHVQVMKDRSIRIQHFIINKENRKMEHRPELWGVFYFWKYMEVMREKKASHLPRPKPCCTVSNIILLLLVIIIDFIVWKTDHLFYLQLNGLLLFCTACKPWHVDKHNLSISLQRQWVKAIS